MCEESHPNIRHKDRGCGEGGRPSGFCQESVVDIRSAAGSSPAPDPHC